MPRMVRSVRRAAPHSPQQYPRPTLTRSFGPLCDQDPGIRRFTTKTAARNFNFSRLRDHLMKLVPRPKNARCPAGHRLKSSRLCYGTQAGYPREQIGHWYQWCSTCEKQFRLTPFLDRDVLEQEPLVTFLDVREELFASPTPRQGCASSPLSLPRASSSPVPTTPTPPSIREPEPFPELEPLDDPSWTTSPLPPSDWAISPPGSPMIIDVDALDDTNIESSSANTEIIEVSRIVKPPMPVMLLIWVRDSGPIQFILRPQQDHTTLRLIDHEDILEQGGVRERRDLEIYRGDLRWNPLLWDSPIPLNLSPRIFLIKARRVLNLNEFDLFLTLAERHRSFIHRRTY